MSDLLPILILAFVFYKVGREVEALLNSKLPNAEEEYKRGYKEAYALGLKQGGVAVKQLIEQEDHCKAYLIVQGDYNV